MTLYRRHLQLSAFLYWTCSQKNKCKQLFQNRLNIFVHIDLSCKGLYHQEHIYLQWFTILNIVFILKKITMSLHLLHRYILDSMLILSNQSIDSQLGIYKLLWLHCQKDIQVRLAWWLHQPQLMYEIELQGEDKFYIQ